ncbi:unnamed protein product [Effrenium voratum]|nr:unnamed protein product [Effrenium voratum]
MAFRRVIAAAARRGMSSEAAQVEEQYPRAMRIMHWTGAAGVLGCVGTVKAAQNSDKDSSVLGIGKGTWMYVHKSMGLLMLGALVPRAALRLLASVPRPVPGADWEQRLAKRTHLALYGLMAAMAGSGTSMGYFSGKGLPFFVTTFAGAPEPHPEKAKKALQAHKFIGFYVLPSAVALHTGAVGLLVQNHS